MKVLQFACANGKGINTTSKMRPKPIPKSIKGRCENDARKSDGKMMEHCVNMESKREPISRKMCKTIMRKHMLTYDIKTGHT